MMNSPVTSIMTRSAVEFLSGKPASPELHSVQIDARGDRRVVTWAEIMQDRRDHQAKILEWKRHVEHWEACRLSVWWSPGIGGTFFRGYHAWLSRIGEDRWLRYPDVALWVRLFPLVLPLGGERDLWAMWMTAFVNSYPAGRKCGKPRGAAIIWRRGSTLARAPE